MITAWKLINENNQTRLIAKWMSIRAFARTNNQQPKHQSIQGETPGIAITRLGLTGHCNSAKEAMKQSCWFDLPFCPQEPFDLFYNGAVHDDPGKASSDHRKVAKLITRVGSVPGQPQYTCRRYLRHSVSPPGFSA